MELVNEPLELGQGVMTALSGCDLLIDGEGHRCHNVAHVPDDVLIILGGGRVRIEDEQSTKVMCETFGGCAVAVGEPEAPVVAKSSP